VIIIAKGKKCFDDSPEALKSMSPLYNAVTLKLSYLSDISGFLALEGVCDMKHDPETRLVTIYAALGECILNQVTAHIQSQHVPVDMIYVEEVKLDDVFREITASSHDKALI
jgi:ABC-2 type transport system ATP-binding protein